MPSAPPSSIAAGSTVEAHVTCAFLTGRTVDRPRLVAEGYGAARTRVLARLGADEEPAAATEQEVLFSAGSESGAEIGAIPFVTVATDALLARVRTANATLADDALFAVEIPSAHADLYDFGVGTLDVTYRLTARTDVHPRVFCRWSTAFRARVEELNKTPVSTVAGDLRAAIRQDIANALFEPPTRRDESFARETEAAWRSYAGALLWIHTTYAHGASPGADARALFDGLSEAIPSHRGAVTLPHAIVCPGNLVSVVVGDGDARWREEAAALTHVIGSMNAWWTAIWELDRLLFSFLNEFNITGRRVVASQLEEQSRRIESLDEHVRLFRALLQTDLLNTSGRERRLWDATAPVWWFDENLAAVENKVAALRELQATLVRELASRRSNRLDAMVAFFTLFAVIGGVASVALWVAPDASSSVRVALTIIVVAVSMLAFAAAFWNRPFTRQRGLRVAEHDVADLAPQPAPASPGTPASP